MKTIPRNLIAIGYAKRTLEAGSREQQRMQLYAARFEAYHMIVFTRASEGLPKQVQMDSLHIHGTHARTRMGMLIAAIRIARRIIRESKGEWIVSSQDPFETSVVGRVATAGGHATHHVQLHGDLFNPHSHRRSLVSFLRVRFGLFIVRTAKCIRVVSHRIERSLIEKGVSRSRISVVPIQADLNAFLAVGEQRQYDMGRPVRFVYVGRFSPEKNVSLIIQSFVKVRCQYRDATLTLVGDGPESDKIRQFINQHDLQDVVQIQGWTNDVASILAHHDVLCLASDHEGWGMVLIEAAAAGMAIITTDVGCAGEVIEHGAHGHVVPVGNSERYAAAMLDYLVNPNHIETHGQNALRTATQLSLTKEQYTDRIIQSYSSCT